MMLGLLLLCVAVILAMMYVGLHLVMEDVGRDRILGGCTLLWTAIATYVLMTQWLPMREPDPLSLMAITLMSTVGYIVGSTLLALFPEHDAQGAEEQPLSLIRH